METPSSPTVAHHQQHRRRHSSVSNPSGPSSSAQNSRRSSRNYGGGGGLAMSRTNSNIGVGGTGAGIGGGDVHESLADELAGAWDDDEDEDDIPEYDEEHAEISQLADGQHHTPDADQGTVAAAGANGDSINGHESARIDDSKETNGQQPQQHQRQQSQTLSPSKQHGRAASSAKQRRHHDRQHSFYDGSEFDSAVSPDGPYGDEDNFPASLSSRIDEIAWLASRPDESIGTAAPVSASASSSAAAGSARQGMATVKEEEGNTNSNGTSPESAVPRLTNSLKDLSTVQQSSVETHTSRLITSHTALASHLAYQTRNIQSLSFPLVSPLALPPDEELVDALLPLLFNALEALPQPAHPALSSISQLSSATSALLSSLSSVSDSLHMSRETMTVASRRLKSAREAAAELRRERDADELGRAWIESGNWDQKLRERDAKRFCGEVVDGFEEVCGVWRERLLASTSMDGSAVADQGQKQPQTQAQSGPTSVGVAG